MPSSKLSVNDFKERLRTEVENLAKNHAWDFSNTTQRGYAFQLWLATVFCSYDQGFETEPEDSLLYSHDLKADIVLEDPTRHHLLIAQCKYQSLSRRSEIAEQEVNDFFNRHSHYLNKDWVKKHASQAAFEALRDYKENFDNGYSIGFYFVSTGYASDRIRELAERCNNQFVQQGVPIQCHLLDFPLLKDLYVRSLSLEESIPAEVRLQLPQDRFFEKAVPYPTVVAVLKGNALRDLYKQYKESLFAWNIRGYLGNRGINKEIVITAEQVPANFFYFNNGVSAICTGYSIDSGELLAQDFQIINGAQTVGALARAKANPDIEVLFRLTEAANVKTEKGINSDIIRFNNSQTVIKVSDFRSNDPIQRWLERQFRELKPRAHLPMLHYVPRRGALNRGLGRGINLEELAKIRYAFLFEPTLVHESPKALWTYQADDGAYEQAFGVGGEVPELWQDDEFQRCLVAIVFYLRIETTSKEDAKKNPSLMFLNRLRYHALALAGIYLRNANEPIQESKLLEHEHEFNECWKCFWPEARRVLIDGYERAMEDNSTLHALTRSRERWQQMMKRFTLYAGIKN